MHKSQPAKQISAGTMLLGFCIMLATLDLESCKIIPAKIKERLKTNAACTKNDIKLAINPSNHQFPTQMDKCASSALGYAEPTEKCIKIHYPALSEPCADCFGKMASCSASNCSLKCITDHFSDACLTCVKTHCRESLVRCTGLPPSKLPPSK